MSDKKFTEIENKIEANKSLKRDDVSGLQWYCYNGIVFEYTKRVIVDDDNKVYDFIDETARTFICEKNGFIEKIKKNNGKIAVALCKHGEVCYSTTLDDYCHKCEIMEVVF